MAQQLLLVFVQRQRLQNQPVALHQLGGAEPQRQPRPLGVVLEEMGHRMDAPVYRTALVAVGFPGVAEINAAGGLPVAGHMQRMVDQFADALVFGRRDGHHRDAQQLLQLVHHDGAAVGAHLVHHVQRQHHGNLQFHQLHGQVEVALDVGGIHNVDDAVRVAFQQKIPRHDLLVGVGGQGIDARQVGNGGLGMASDDAVLAVHRHAGEIAHMLVGAGQLVEQGGLAAVLVAGQRKVQRLALGDGRAGLAVVVAGGLAQFAHAGMGYHPMAALLTGGPVGGMYIANFNFERVIQTQRQLISPQLQLDGVAHGGYLAQCHLGAGGQAHVQQMLAQRPLSAHGLDERVLSNMQFRQCHSVQHLFLFGFGMLTVKSLPRLTCIVNSGAGHTNDTAKPWAAPAAALHSVRR